MIKAAAAFATVVLAFSAFSVPCSAGARVLAHPPDRAAWVVAPGLSGYSGYPWAGPPWTAPVPTPRTGCYAFRQHLSGAWRDVVVCE